jgi:hypothetical protein
MGRTERHQCLARAGYLSPKKRAATLSSGVPRVAAST